MYDYPPPSKKKKIAIFDDDEDTLSVCTYILEEWGWQVHTFTDCNGIMDKVSSILPDVILMDDWIPDVGGVAATQTLKNADGLKNIPVIYFSANNEIKSLANQAGADSFLAKPFELSDLQDLITKVIKNGD